MLRLSAVLLSVLTPEQEDGSSVPYAMGGSIVHVLVCFGEMPRELITFSSVLAAQLHKIELL